MAFTVRMIVTNATGDPVAILRTRRLSAKTLRDAKVEANRRLRALNHLAPSVLEIIDDSGEDPHSPQARPQCSDLLVIGRFLP